MNFKEFLKEKGITDEAYAEMDAKGVAKLHAEYQDKVAKDIKDAFESFKQDNDVKTVTMKFDAFSKSLIEQGEILAKLETTGTAEPKLSFKEQIAKELKGKTDALKSLKTERHGSVRIEMKAVGDMTLGTNVTGQIPQAEREAGITRIVRRQPYILDLVSVGTISSNLWEWVEQKNAEGAPAMTGEGLAKAQIDFDLVLASAKVEKVTAYIKVSKEMLDDVPLMEAEINEELRERINLTVDDQILGGDGISPNITGILDNAVAFAAGSFAAAVDEANNTDVLRVAINQIMVAQFMPNYIVMHPSDVAAMDLQKGTDGHYVLPPFTTAQNNIVKGVPIISNTGITEGDYLVGDFTKSAVRFKEGLTIDVGYENDDFTKNFVTILAEARLVHRVKSNHYPAFVTGDFTTDKAALETV